MAYLFAPLPPDTRRALDGIPALIDKTFPLPGRFRSALPADVAELSRLLTSGRGERSLSYLGRPNLLSAYLRYFLPWNIYRLCRLLPALPLALAAGDTVVDLGSGPMTLAAALWICRPDLRNLPLEFRCIDRSGPALEAGKKFFSALAGEPCPWKIRAVKEAIDSRAVLGKQPSPAAEKPPAEKSVIEKSAAEKSVTEKPVALVCAVNVCNEMYGAIPQSNTEALGRSAENAARLLCAIAAERGSILVVEPGVPQSGQFISLLRGALIEQGRPPLSPCTHRGECPFPGGITRASRSPRKSPAPAVGKGRWCHFAFETVDAPEALHKLSAAAGIPKERAVLSFLLASPARPAEQPIPPQIPLRVISDAFPLPALRFGRYACSERGLVLVTGNRAVIEKTASGAALTAAFAASLPRDPKSGAVEIALDSAGK